MAGQDENAIHKDGNGYTDSTGNHVSDNGVYCRNGVVLDSRVAQTVEGVIERHRNDANYDGNPIADACYAGAVKKGIYTDTSPDARGLQPANNGQRSHRGGGYRG